MIALYYFFQALPFVVAMGLALALIALVVAALNNPTVALVLLVGVFLFETSLLGGAAINLGIWFYAADLLAVVLTPALAYRVLVLRRGGDIHPAWWLLGGVQLALFVWGLAKFGTGAGVDFRLHYYIWTGAAYLATFEFDEAQVRRVLRALWWVGLGICAIAWYRWIGAELDPEFERQLRRIDTTGVAFLRVIGSAPTLMLALASLVSLYLAMTRQGGPGHWLWAMLFAVTVLALQHRSVWVAALLATIFLLVLLRRGRSDAGVKMLLLGLGVATLLGLLVASGRFQDATASIQDQAARGVNLREGTFAGRVSGWQSLLKDWLNSGSPVTYLVGKPFGGGYQRYSAEVGGQAINYSPHNYYVFLLYRGGVLGLAAFVWIYALAVRAAWRRWRESGDAHLALWLAMACALLLYYIPYAVSYPQMLVVGPLLWLAGERRASGKPARLADPATSLKAMT